MKKSNEEFEKLNDEKNVKKVIMSVVVIVLVIIICVLLYIVIKDNGSKDKENDTLQKDTAVTQETTTTDDEDPEKKNKETQNSSVQETTVQQGDGFSTVNESVTAKEQTNLRDKPSQDSDSKVMLTLNNGDVATRTGINSNGWSRIEYNGYVYYAISSYLTTDLNYIVPTQEGAASGDGLSTKFTDCNENVTAKIEVNLRALPSVLNPDATVMEVLHNGDIAVRTGINTEVGWSRIQYNGQILYCISSYVTVVQ